MGTIFSDEDWTQAQIHASSPAEDNSYLTSPDGYGTLSIDSTGAYTYGLLNGTNGFNIPVQRLAAGETVQDIFTVQVTDDQGASTTTTATVNVTGINDRPIVDLNGSSAGTGVTLNYTENDPATRIAPPAFVNDIDSANFNGGSLTVSFGATRTSADRLSIKDGGLDGAAPDPITLNGADVLFNGNVIGTFSGGGDGANLVVTFTTDDATLAAAQALVSHIRYFNNSDAPSTAPRSVTFTINDGDGTANGGTSTTTATATLNVAAVNDAPVVDLDPTEVTEAGLGYQANLVADGNPFPIALLPAVTDVDDINHRRRDDHAGGSASAAISSTCQGLLWMLWALAF